MARAKLKGKDIRKIGYQEGRVIGLAIQVMETHYKGKSRVFKLDLLKRVLENPAFYTKDDKLGGIAQELLVQKEAAQKPVLNTQRKPYRIYGAEDIEEGARHQMEVAMKLPITVEGALMPDAHQGYGLPIGGVLATDNAVIPYGVGVDIGCRMCLTMYDMPESFIGQNTDSLKKMLVDNTRFGQAAFKHPEDDAVLERKEFSEIQVVKSLKDRAYSQIGSSGGGNHFVEFGVVEILDPDNEFQLPPGQYVGVLSHSGSRGLGANIARNYTQLAKQLCQLPDEARHLAWLTLDSEEGQEYWQAMNLAGDYASACHHQIHRRLSRALGEKHLAMVENHHNFCIEESQVVPTTEGPIPIKNIKPGHLIYAFDEKLGLVKTPVREAWCSGKKAIYEIKTRNRHIRCSADHPLLTVEVRKKHELDPTYKRAMGQYVWKRAENIQQGDILVCAEGYYEYSKPIGKEKARFAGAFLGDGWIRKKNTHISGYAVGFAIGSALEVHTKTYQKLLETIFPTKKWKNNGAGAYGLSCSSREVYTEIVSLELGVSSKEAKVPNYIFSATYDEKLAFLAGYIDADGSISANKKNAGRGTIATVSKELAYGIREIAVSCKLCATPVREENRTTNYGSCKVYRYTLSADSVNLLDLWHQTKSSNRRATLYQKPQGLQTSKLGYIPLPERIFAQTVQSNKKLGKELPVYDLSIEHPSHAFVCEGIIVHNCWQEEWNNKKVYVHRKGATPAGKGVLGVIPGSMTAPGFIVRGKGDSQSINSAAHGAGRVMSRTQAKKTITQKMMQEHLKQAGVELIGAGLDEAPMAYKNIHQVMQYQQDLVDVVGIFYPRIVRMCGGNFREVD